MLIDLGKYHQALTQINPIRVNGKVSEIIGLVVEGIGPAVSIGEICGIYSSPEEDNPIIAEVVGFRKGKVLLMPLESMRGLGPGCRIVAIRKHASIRAGKELLGRVIDGLGNPIDNKGTLNCSDERPIYIDPLNPMDRGRIQEPIDLGVRAVNGLLTCGKGQRVGIFAGSGVGKSMLLGMFARNTRADINVIGLIGERGREVRDFLEKNLGPEGLAKSVIVVATSDTHPLIRMRAAYVSTAIAEYFRDQGGKDVLLMIDSLTRFAMAQREVGLSIGEPPTTKGYTPSVFSMLPKLLERAGNLEDGGSITGLYTILVEGDDFNEPISDTARSILDGHILLSRELASKNHYPAIDILNSKSRLMTDVTDGKHRKNAGEILNLMSVYKKAEDMINIGAYVKGSNKDIDRSIQMMDRINAFLCQDIDAKITLPESAQELDALLH